MTSSAVSRDCELVVLEEMEFWVRCSYKMGILGYTWAGRCGGESVARRAAITLKLKLWWGRSFTDTLNSQAK